MNPLLTVAIRAARAAGRIALRHHSRVERLQVTRKGRNDFVSEVDRRAEAEIVDTIHSRYPNHRIIAEEGGTIAPANANDAGAKDAADVEWLVDPLDGTANYLHGHPQFAVSIAARADGRLQHAVIFDPLRDELYTASRGGGAYLNDRRIRVSGQDRLARCLLASGFPHKDAADLPPWLRSFNAMLPCVSDVRLGGSAALDLAFVAAGRVDGYWQRGLAAWDIAAGALLVREAGGLVTDYAGGQDFLEGGKVVAGCPRVFDALRRVVERAEAG